MTKHEIVVGIDESPSGRHALAWAARQARATGSRLRALHILNWPLARDLYYTNPVVPDYVYPDPEEVEERYRLPSSRVFTEVKPEPSWTLQFGQGHAGRVLVAESADSELLVLGTREHTGIGRLVNGSVGHYCLNHARCPVVGVPLLAGSADLRGEAGAGQPTAETSV
jgi:nucleotide-binding universal stress UspA family protein